MNKKKILIMSVTIGVILGVGIGVYSTKIYQKPKDTNKVEITVTSTRTNEKLVKALKNLDNFYNKSKLQKTGTADLGDKKVDLAKDKYYSYKLNMTSGKVLTAQLITKSSNSSTLNEKDMKTIAEKCIEKMYSDTYKDFVFVSATPRDNGDGGYTQLIYKEVTKDGFNTGETASLEINSAGDLIGVAAHEGNRAALKNLKINVNKDKAIDIFIKYIKNKIGSKTDLQINKSDIKIDQTVYKDKVVWLMQWEEKNTQNTSMTSPVGYTVLLNVETGKIEYEDSLL